MAFESPNYTQTPNDLFDSMLADMKYAELKVTLIAIRKALGFHRGSFRLTVTAMAKLTGLSRVSVLEGAEQAEKRGTLTKLNDGGVIEWTVNLLDGAVNLLNSDRKPSIPPSSKETSKETSIKKVSAKKPRKPSKPPEETCPQEWMTRLHLLTGISITSASPRSRKEIKDCGLALIHSGHTLEQIDLFERNWLADKWRRDNHILPKPRDIQDKFDAIIHNGNGATHGSNSTSSAAGDKPSRQQIESGARINAQRNGTTYEAELARLEADYA